ncbi:MAG: ankyrin repeat domain-containing protein [Chlamydiota bacterium]|jgi:ankyrin repeat protein
MSVPNALSRAVELPSIFSENNDREVEEVKEDISCLAASIFKCKSKLSYHLTKKAAERVFRAIEINDSNNALEAIRSNRFDINYIHEGKKAFHIAVEKGSLIIVKTLEAKGADINEPDQDGLTSLEKALALSRFEIVWFLLSLRQIDLKHIPRPTLDLLLHKGIEQNKYVTIQKLIAAGADVNGVDQDGLTPIEKAFEKLHFRIVKYLLTLNEVDLRHIHLELKTRLLHLAVEKYDIDIVRKLITAGADINGLDENNQTPLEKAIDELNFEIAYFFLSHSQESLNPISNKAKKALFFQATQENYDVTKMLLEYGMNVNEKNILNVSPLMQATKAGRLDIMEMLLQSPNIDVNIQGSLDNRTALFFIFTNPPNTVASAEILLKHGADINKQTIDGTTVLVEAASKGDFPLAQLLLNHPNLDINLADNDHNTAIFLALNNQHFNIVWRLLDERAIELDAKFSDLLIEEIRKTTHSNEILMNIFLKSFFKTNARNRKALEKAFESITEEDLSKNGKLQFMKKCLDMKVTYESVDQAIKEVYPFIPQDLTLEIAALSGIVF